MRSELIHRFTTHSYYHDAHLVLDSSDIFGILYSRYLDNASQHDSLLSLAVFDLEKKKCEQVVTYSGLGPEPISDRAWERANGVNDAALQYDTVRKRWILAQLHGNCDVAMRTVTLGDDARPQLSPLCVLYHYRGPYHLEPFLDLEIREDSYRLLFPRPTMEGELNRHSTPPAVTCQDIAFHPGWSTLQEQAVVVRSGDEATRELRDWDEWLKALPERDGHQLATVLSSKKVFFDPHFVKASPTSEAEISRQDDMASTAMALSISNGQTRLLLLCSPERWVSVHSDKKLRSSVRPARKQWRIWLTGWQGDELVHTWTYAPDIHVSTVSDQCPDPSFGEPEVDVAAIVGPTSRGKRPTFVVVMAMQDWYKQVQSHGVCLDDQGRVVQVCRTTFGQRPTLCRCQEIVIGVDKVEEGWRLWNWAVLDEEDLRMTIALHPACQRVFVRSEPETERFWLIEELPGGVRVSRRNAQTLAEVTPAAQIMKVKLLFDQRPIRSLDGHRVGGLFPYKETLLLLLEWESLALYQVQ